MPKSQGINSLIKLIDESLGVKFPNDKIISNSLKQLISSMIVVEPQKRIGYEDFMNHPFIK